MRTISAAATKALMDESTSSAFPLLLEITHPSLGTPIRVTNNGVDLVYDANTYTAYPFRIDLPDEDNNKISNARITIDNIDRSLMAIIRGSGESLAIKTIATFYNNDSGTLFEPLAQWEFRLDNVVYNIDTITAELVYEDRMNNRLPAMSFTPFSFPGIH